MPDPHPATSPRTKPNQTVILIRARITNARQALRPVAAGVVAAALATSVLLQLDLGLSPVPMRIALTGLWAAALLGGFAMAWRRTLRVDLTRQGMVVRRLLAGEQSYPPNAIVMWGVEHERGVWNTLPPPPDSPRRMRFMIEAADGFRLEVKVPGRVARHAVVLLLDQAPKKPQVRMRGMRDAA